MVIFAPYNNKHDSTEKGADVISSSKSYSLTYEAVTLDDILQAKEARSLRRNHLFKKYNLPLVSITVNMPGSVKDLPILRGLCDCAVDELKTMFIIHQSVSLYLPTGPEAMLVIDAEPSFIKACAVEIEERYPFGRLLDIDVFAADGTLMSRRQQGKSRKCLVCGCDAIVCMREKRHTADELLSAVKELLAAFAAYRTKNVSAYAEKIGAFATEAMLYEAACTPAPGLVDRDNSGAHKDMDFYSFMASSAALSSSMTRLAQAGINHTGPLTELLPVLRIIGAEAERAMFEATGGVNTQKGLLFSLGIAAAAAGCLWKDRNKFGADNIADNILGTIAGITEGIVNRELAGSCSKPEASLTAGERLYREYGVTGIRGEMEQGLPSVREKALPALQEALMAGLSANDALVNTLLTIMTAIDDTTVMHRHDPQKLRCWVRKKASEALAAGGMGTEKGRIMISNLDKEFIDHNVSPGGAADLLAVSWFIHRMVSDYQLERKGGTYAI